MGMTIADLDAMDEGTWVDMLIIFLKKTGIQTGKIKQLPPMASKAQIDELFSKKKDRAK